MAYKRYNHSNNAICTLALPITNATMQIKFAGNYGRLPTSNFILKITEYDTSGTVIGRENILFSSRDGDTGVVQTRACEPVPINNDASENIQQALNFSEGAIAEVVISSAVLNDVQDEVIRLGTAKSDNTGTPYTTRYYDSTGKEKTLDFSGEDNIMKVMGINKVEGKNVPALVSPSVDIHNLEEVTELEDTDELIVYNGAENKKTTVGKMTSGGKNDVINLLNIIPGMSYTGNSSTDWNVSSNQTISSLDGIIPDAYGVVYRNINITGGKITTSRKDNYGSILIIRCKNFTMSGGTIDMSALGGLAGSTSVDNPISYKGRSLSGISTPTATTGTANFPGIGSLEWFIKNLACGSGGLGSTDGYGGGYTMYGGNGGGMVIIIAEKINITGGSILANGENGKPEGTSYGGGGTGGGGGGTILIASLKKDAIVNGTLQAKGGNGASGQNRSGGWDNSYNGGGGGGNISTGGNGGNYGAKNLAGGAGINGNPGTTGQPGGTGATNSANGNYTSAGNGGGGAGGEVFVL